MNTKQYKERLFMLLEKLKKELPAFEREAIAEEIREMIEILIPKD